MSTHHLTQDGAFRARPPFSWGSPIRAFTKAFRRCSGQTPADFERGSHDELMQIEGGAYRGYVEVQRDGGAE
jgi:hypothetical protein